MKKIFIIIGIITAIVIIVGIVIFTNNNNDSMQGFNAPSGTRLSSNINEERSENRIKDILQNQDQNQNQDKNKIEQGETHEIEISTFSTQILDDAPGRLNNISITCSTLNGTIVKNGDTFSFNETIGKPTSARGYQEAKIIVNHEAELGIGGRKLPSKFYFI